MIFRCKSYICATFAFATNLRLTSTQLLFEIPSLRVISVKTSPLQQISIWRLQKYSSRFLLYESLLVRVIVFYAMTTDYFVQNQFLLTPRCYRRVRRNKMLDFYLFRAKSNRKIRRRFDFSIRIVLAGRGQSSTILSRHEIRREGADI